jgi:pSer/pThr/pTyr-binding forkhead associated (FHA) protein
MSLELTRADVLVGRHSECDVRLPLPDVSRKHCRFQFHSGCWQVVDENSLNGTFVNEQAVEKTVLRHGDRVRIGGFTFLVELQAEAVATAEAESLARSLFQERAARVLWPPKRQAS